MIEKYRELPTKELVSERTNKEKQVSDLTKDIQLLTECIIEKEKGIKFGEFYNLNGCTIKITESVFGLVFYDKYIKQDGMSAFVIEPKFRMEDIDYKNLTPIVNK